MAFQTNQNSAITANVTPSSAAVTGTVATSQAGQASALAGLVNNLVIPPTTGTSTEGPILFPIPSTIAGDFVIPHTLGRVPFAAVPVATSDGLIRLALPWYDDANIYLTASGAGLTGYLFLW